MSTYSYFPGCSLEKMALSYHQSAMQTTNAVGVELQEIEDWNCCGATTYFHGGAKPGHGRKSRA